MRDPILELFNIGEVNFIVQILVRVFLSLLVSIFLGVERANKRHAAGLRTFIIVSLTGSSSGISVGFTSACCLLHLYQSL